MYSTIVPALRGVYLAPNQFLEGNISELQDHEIHKATFISYLSPYWINLCFLILTALYKLMFKSIWFTFFPSS